MRIISKFHDYYDGVQCYGTDPSLVYLRERSNERMHWTDVPKTAWYYPLAELLVKQFPGELNGYMSRMRLIGFCGRLYPCFDWYGETMYDTTTRMLDKINVAKDREQVEKALNKDTKRHYWTRPFTYRSWQETIDRFKGKYDHLFTVPVFAVAMNDCRYIEVELNPRLKDLRFQTVKGPVEAYQEIAMYLGNELVVQRDPIPVITDEVMRDKKGFDKWSFRRHKDDVY